MQVRASDKAERVDRSNLYYALSRFTLSSIHHLQRGYDPMLGLRATSALLISLLAFAKPTAAQEDALQIVNGLRTLECPRHLERNQRLEIDSALNAAAKHIKNGAVMREALQRAGYPAIQSAMIRFAGVRDNAELKRMLAKTYCQTLTNVHLVEVGIAREGREIAIVLAAPFTPPTASDAARISREVLQLVNNARAQARRCGSKRFAPTHPLVLNDTLGVAAVAHAKDMAAHNILSHDGSDGSSPGERATRAKYSWTAVGENVASGPLSAKEVVDGWLNSPGHCVNIMDTDFTQMAVAYALTPKPEQRVYWAQEFGRPR